MKNKKDDQIKEDKKQSEAVDTSLAKELEEAKKKAEEYLNSWKTERADFINYKNSESKRVEEIVKYSSEGLMIEVLDAMDGLDMALKNTPESVKKDSGDWLVGLKSVSKNLLTLFERYGIQKIKVEGEKFDPIIHEVIHVQDEGGNNIEEIRPGYKMYDRVIRPARIKIVK